jgi:RNase P subunit RPR2
MTEEVARPQPRSPTKANEVGWVGFICKECEAPLAVHRSASASTSASERSTRGWRVTCTGCGVTEYYEVGTPMVRIAAS